MNPTPPPNNDLLDHLKGRIAQMETQLSQLIARQARQPLPTPQPQASTSAVAGAEGAAAIEQKDLEETAVRLVRMSHNPNFAALMRGLPEKLRDALATLAVTPMLSHEHMHQTLAQVWQEGGATVPDHFDAVLSPVVRGFVSQPQPKREAAVDSITAYLIDQLVKFTQPSDDTLRPQLNQMQQALDDTGLAPEDIDPHTPEGQQALNYLMAGQMLRQTSALVRQQMQQVQAAAEAEVDAAQAAQAAPQTPETAVNEAPAQTTN